MLNLQIPKFKLQKSPHIEYFIIYTAEIEKCTAFLTITFAETISVTAETVLRGADLRLVEIGISMLNLQKCFFLLQNLKYAMQISTCALQKLNFTVYI